MTFDQTLLDDARDPNRPHLDNTDEARDMAAVIRWLADAARGNAALIERLAGQVAYLEGEFAKLRGD